MVVLPKFDYKVSSECEGDDLSLHYMPEARPLGSKDKFSAEWLQPFLGELESLQREDLLSLV